MKSFLTNYRVSVPSAIALVGVLAWVAFGYFGVHKAFIDEKVSEAAPVFDATPPTTADAPPSTTTPATTPATTITPATTAAPATTVAPTTTTPQPVTEAAGSFVSRNHPTEGTAIVLGNGSGQRFLRFEQFETDNGPDLKVYLVNSAAGGVSDHVSLGALKGNIGDQNYEIPAGVDLTVYDTVLIWCERFASPFGEATLQPA
ncbi:MAG: DM13 domain-containing protein [Actinomycetota bacterium]|nr:DM13 domain-containing protein [Actinomycetota bacterium]